MAPRIKWREVLAFASAENVNAWLEDGKLAAGKNQCANCTMCVSIVPHTMRYQLLSCRSKTCKKAYPGIACEWKGKVTTCSTSLLTSVYEVGEHLSSAQDSPQQRLKEEHKQYCRLMATEGLKPLRIRNGLRIKFEMPSESMPTLSTVQSFVNNFAKKKLAKHDRIHDIDAMVRGKANYALQSDDNAPLPFSWPSDENGQIFVGKGTDLNPFLAGVTTKTLLRKLDRPSSSCVLHVDAAYKLSQVGYPVLVIGISDRCRTFHLVAFCIVSQTTELVYTGALASLNRLYTALTGRAIELTYVMGDADDAQHNALRNVFEPTSKHQFLMCFFHVLLNVNKTLQAVSASTTATIRRDIYDMHFSSSPDDFLRLVTGAVKRWDQLSDAPHFAAYCSKEWFSKRFVMWQCFWTPPGYATTNNPVEQFSRHIKQHYSLHLKLKTRTLLLLLFQCASSEPISARPFREVVGLPSTRSTRMQELARERLLIENAKFSYSEDGIVAVLGHPAKRVYVPAKKTNGGVSCCNSPARCELCSDGSGRTASYRLASQCCEAHVWLSLLDKICLLRAPSICHATLCMCRLFGSRNSIESVVDSKENTRHWKFCWPPSPQWSGTCS